MELDQHMIANLLTLGGFVVLVTVYVVNAKNSAKLLGGRLEIIDETLDAFKAEMKKLQEVVLNQALQSERLNQMDQRMLAQGRRLDRMEGTVWRMPKLKDETKE